MVSNRAACHIYKWFSANKLALNLDKTNIIKFITNNLIQYKLNIGYNDKYIEKSVNTKLLGFKIDNHLNWKKHTDHLVPKLSAVCYAVRSKIRISNTDTLKSIYFAYFHSPIKLGNNFLV
jgi:hypothetical protein